MMASGPFDLIGPPATTRTSNRRHRLLAGDQEQRSGVVHVRVEVGKFVAFSGRMPSGGRLARRHRARLNASEMRGVMGKAVGCPELAVADAIDTGFDLPVHRFGDNWRDLRGDDRGVRYLGAGKPPRYVLPALGRRQPAHMRFLCVSYSVACSCTPAPACDPAHDNATNIVIEPVAAPTQRKLPFAEFARSLGAVYESHQRHAVTQRAVFGRGPLIEVEPPRR